MRRRLDFDVFSMAGIIFTICGLPVFCLGAWMAMNMEWLEANGEGDVWIMPPLFLGMGGLSLGLGILLVVLWIRRMRARDRALEKGVYFWGEVTGVQTDWHQQIQHMPTVFMTVSAEIDGEARIFEGPRRHIREVMPDVGYRVRVYLDRDTGTYAITDASGNLL